MRKFNRDISWPLFLFAIVIALACYASVKGDALVDRASPGNPIGYPN